MLRTRVRAGPIAGLVLSLVFACLLTAIQAGDRYVSAWAPRFGHPVPVTLRVPYGPRIVRDTQTGRADLHYEHRRVVVPMGAELNSQNEEQWTAFIYETLHRPPHWPRLAGVFVIFFTLGMALTSYLRRFGQSRLRLLEAAGGSSARDGAAGAAREGAAAVHRRCQSSGSPWRWSRCGWPPASTAEPPSS